MVELRFNATKPNGQLITGNLAAENYGEGKKKILELLQKNKLKLQSIDKKSTFIYKIRRGAENPIKGEQRAFNK
ncbi:MAG: type II secretion system F family protein, partial [Bacteroidetes bacterium]|nr:type II secretion system F family protein [Bacteroidota bacterium]